jgi:S1-C subfamily serine protease
MKILSYRSFMPFDNRTDSSNASLSPATERSVMPFNNVHTIQDIIDGRPYNYMHGNGDWNFSQETTNPSYKENESDYKRIERDLSRWKRDDEIAQKLLGNGQVSEQHKWEVKVDGGSIYFMSFDLARKYLRENKLPFKSLSRVAQNVNPEDERVGAIADVLNKCVMVESINMAEGVKETGSAFCVKKGYFITCAHVIRRYNKYEENITEVGFKETILNLVQNGRRYKAQLITVSPKWDIALLRCDLDIEPFEIETEMMVGQDIFAVGSPHGYENNVSVGTIGSLNRKLFFYKEAPDYMFADLAIFPGNSGGPIVKSDDGKVIGMVTLVVSSSAGYGLNAALPANYIQEFCKQNIAGF